MKKPVKILAFSVLGIVVLIAIAIGVVLANINSLAKRAVESGGTYALGVPTKVDSVSLGIFGGNLTISGLDIANPQGFSSPHFLDLKKGHVDVTLGTIRRPLVEIPTLSLSGVDVNLERAGGGANYSKILDNLSKLKSNTPAQPNPNEKRFVVRRLTIENVAIHANMLGAPGAVGSVLNQQTKLEIPIERIELKDVGRTGTGVSGTGVTMEELASIVVQAVLNAAAEKGNLPDLKSQIAALGDLSKLQTTITAKADEALKKAGAEAGKAVDDAAKQVEQGLGNLLGGGKKDEKKPEQRKP